MRALLTALTLIAVTALAPGCKARHDVTLEVRPDLSGELAWAFGLDDDATEWLEEAERSGGAPGDADALWREMRGLSPDDPPGSRHEPWEADGFSGERFVVPFADPNALHDLFAPGPPGSGAGFEGSMLTVSRVGDELRFEFDLPAYAELTVVGPFGDLADDPSVREAAGGDPRRLLDVRFTLRLPGAVFDHNADRVEPDGTLVWDLLPVPSGPARVAAHLPERGEAAGAAGRVPWRWPALVAVPLVVALGAWRRRTRTRDGVSDRTM
jgi:hypothetical protein